MHRLLALAVLVCGSLRAGTVLVLPFFNQSRNASLDWIGESIAETVHDALASEGLLVLDREDRLEAYRRLSLRPGAALTHASVIKIGESLDAASVVYGYFEVLDPGADPAKSPVVITARIVDLKHSRQGATLKESGPLAGLASLSVHLGWQALTAVQPKGAPSEQDFVKARPPVRIDAVESYIRGLLAGSSEQRQRLFTQAARLDDHYSQPCFQLGKAYWAKKEYRTAAQWLERVGRTDPHYLESQFFLGLCRFFTADFAAAEKAFQTVAASVPLNEVYNNLGAAEARRNDSNGAIGNFQKALEGDSGDPDYHFNLGYALWRAGRFEEAAQSFRAVLERNPSDAEAMTLLGRALQGEGPRATETRAESRERLKTNYDEAAYRQLQAELARD